MPDRIESIKRIQISGDKWAEMIRINKKDTNDWDSDRTANDSGLQGYRVFMNPTVNVRGEYGKKRKLECYENTAAYA